MKRNSMCPFCYIRQLFMKKRPTSVNPTFEEPIIRYNAKTDDNDSEFLVGNTPGVVLPSTGGNGTLLYTLAGLALILLAGGLLAVGKRKAA